MHILFASAFCYATNKKDDYMRKKEGRIRRFFRDLKDLIREVIWEGMIQGLFSFLFNMIFAIFRFILQLFK